jgi:hypothetical protein
MKNNQFNASIGMNEAQFNELIDKEFRDWLREKISKCTLVEHTEAEVDAFPRPIYWDIAFKRAWELAYAAGTFNARAVIQAEILKNMADTGRNSNENN